MTRSLILLALLMGACGRDYPSGPRTTLDAADPVGQPCATLRDIKTVVDGEAIDIPIRIYYTHCPPADSLAKYGQTVIP